MIMQTAPRCLPYTFFCRGDIGQSTTPDGRLLEGVSLCGSEGMLSIFIGSMLCSPAQKLIQQNQQDSDVFLYARQGVA